MSPDENTDDSMDHNDKSVGLPSGATITLMTSASADHKDTHHMCVLTAVCYCSTLSRLHPKIWTQAEPDTKAWCRRQRLVSVLLEYADNVSVMSRACDLVKDPFPPTQPPDEYCLCPPLCLRLDLWWRQNNIELQWYPVKSWLLRSYGK